MVAAALSVGLSVACATTGAGAADLGGAYGGIAPDRRPFGDEIERPFAPPAYAAPAGPLRPTRRVTGGPDYAGSDYGLAKPSFYGMSPRPDWGRGNLD